MNKTSWISTKDSQNRDWYIIDASKATVGRIASVIAVYLTGKNREDYVPNIDCGNYVVVVNVDKLKYSGRKAEYKTFERYSGYPGGRKVIKVKGLIKDNPKLVLLHAVKGMLPKNRLQQNYLNRLKIYVGNEHPHKNVNLKEINL